MITTLDRYILRQVLFPATIAFVLIGFLAVAAEVSENAEALPRGFLTPMDIGFLVMFLFPSLLALLVPIAYFVGILMAFGRLAQQGEIAAMQSAGISLKRLTRITVLTSVVLSFVCYGLQDWLQPLGMARAYDILYHELPQRATIDKLDAGELHNYDGLRIHFSSKDESTHTLYDFDLIQPVGDGVILFHADEAQLTLDDAQYTLNLRKGYSVNQQNVHLQFDYLRKPFPIPVVADLSGSDDDLQSLSKMLDRERALAELEQHNGESADPGTLRKLRQNIAHRLCDPFACLAVALVGTPMGVQARRKGRTSLFGVGLSVLVLYYTLVTLVEPSGVVPLGTSIALAWIPNLVLMAIGLGLLWRVDRA